MDQIYELLAITLGAILANNFIFSQFLAAARSWAFPRRWIPPLAWAWPLPLLWVWPPPCASW